MAMQAKKMDASLENLLSMPLHKLQNLSKKDMQNLDEYELNKLYDHINQLEKQLDVDKKEFVSTLRDFIVQMAKAYPLNTELSINSGRLTSAIGRVDDEIVNSAGAFLITRAADDVVEYNETGNYNKFFESGLFDYSEEALVENTELLDSERIAKYLMELFKSMKDDLLAKDVQVVDPNNIDTTISIRKQAANYISELTSAYGSIGICTGAFEEDDDE